MPDKSLEQIGQELEALQERANQAVAAAEEDTSKFEETQKLVNDELKPQIELLTRERANALQVEEFKAMKSDVETLGNVIADLRKPSGRFVLPEGETEQDDQPYGKALEDGTIDWTSAERSMYRDVLRANKGDTEARERLIEGFEGLDPEGKAMTEGVNAQGGYLVRPQVERRIIETLESDNVLRSLCSKLNVNTNAIQLDQITVSTTAGWVAELATKPESTGVTLATVTANVFTAAGLATVSNQLLQDSNPAVDGLVTSDLAKRLTALEESAFISGTGTNQPLGLLNTPGLGATALTSTAVDVLLLSILDAIAAVETNHGAPSAILMHPRTWTRILKAQNAGGAFLISPESDFQDPRTGFRGPQKSLWGYRVVTSNRVPTNLGGGTNESRVIVGDFGEALILDRTGIAVDESPHVYFTSNQTVFRAEKRVGFTAARTPLAFNVVGGVGLANG